MSVNVLSESEFQTPTSVAPDSDDQNGGTDVPESSDVPNLGASPELTGPTTRSGKKRKSCASNRGSSKKKKMTTRSPPAHPKPDTVVNMPTAQEPVPGPVPSSTPAPSGQQDLVALLTNGLSTIQTSMSGMEARLAGKIDNLETTVAKNKETIMSLANSVNKNTVDLARLETQIRATDESFDRRVNDLIRAREHSVEDCLRPLDVGVRGPSPDQIARYWKCRKSLRLWPVSGADLAKKVEGFLGEFLGVQDVEIVEVRRVIEPLSKIKDEVVAEFVSSLVRDHIKSMGFKLQGENW